MPGSKGLNQLTESEHIGPDETGDNINAKRNANYIWDTNSSTWIRMTASGVGSAVTVADGANVVEGATTDAAVTAGGAGTISGKLRRISADITSGSQKTQVTDSSGNELGPAQDFTLLRLLNQLSRPIYYNAANNTLRIDINSGTVTTVTTLSQLAGFDTKLTLQYPTERNLWANAIRSNVA
jgi:hypothetical protein